MKNLLTLAALACILLMVGLVVSIQADSTPSAPYAVESGAR